MTNTFVKVGTFLLISILLCSCVAPTKRVSGIAYAAAQSAYVRNAGTKFQIGLGDVANITMIDGKEMPRSTGGAGAWEPAVEVPAGTHTVEIIYREESAGLSALASLFWGSPSSVHVDVSKRTLEVIFEPNQLYRPHASDDCGKEWFWIEDLGVFDPTSRFVTGSDGTKPVVAGNAPPENCGQLN